MTDTNPSSASSSGADLPIHTTDIVLNLIVVFLAPIFLSATNGDITLARLAALETVSTYRAQSHTDLLEVAQIVAFGFATLGSLCLSMADDISLTMILRLRGNANALSRSGETHRRRLEQNRANITQTPADPPAQATDPLPRPSVATPPPVQPAVAPPLPPRQDDTHALWAAALAKAAEQFTAELPHLSPAEQRMAAIQAAALNACASDLLAEANAEHREPGQDDPKRPYVQDPSL